jgi:tetratricopeptide (TPR) repeat protein
MGWIKVLDYGIAKREDGLLETEAGAIMGTMIYSAPEQNMGAVVDARADMYSLGLILYEMLTGKRAISGRNLQEIREEQQDDLDPPSEIAENIPEELDEICELLTQRMADERIENATKLLIELGKLRVGGDESIEAKLIKDGSERRLMAARQAVFEEKWEFVENMCQRMQAKGEVLPQVTFFRAKACSQLGKHDLAGRQYEKAIFQDQENIQFAVDYAVALIQQKNYSKAIKVLHAVPVGTDETANILVRGLLELLSRQAEWPDLEAIQRQREKEEARRNSFIGRLWNRITGA